MLHGASRVKSQAKESAGGVTIDFGAHPLYLIYHLLGMPEEVQASYGRITGRAVEDNAVVTMRYPNGTLAVPEASFVGGHSPFVIEAHGTEASLLYGGPKEALLLTGAHAGSNVGWTEQAGLPEDLPSPFGRWVEQARNGTTDGQNIRIALALSSLADAANRSAAEGRPVPPRRLA